MAVARPPFRTTVRAVSVPVVTATHALATVELLPPRSDRDGTSRRLLECALQRFAEHGYHGVSIRDIARATGLSASSVYAHVASKEQLLAELSTLAHEEHRDLLRAALLEAGVDPQEQVRAFVRAHVLFHARYALLARVANRELAALAPADRARVLSIRLDSQRLLEQIVARGRRAGVFTVGDDYLAVAAIAAMGLRVAEWWTPETTYPVAEVADTYAAFAVKLLR